MIIILEGNECTYKTTLQKHIAHELRSKGIGCIELKGSNFESARSNHAVLMDFYRETLDRATMYDVAIIDRYLISNIVYATLYNGYTRLTQNQVNELMQRLKTLNTMMIRCMAPVDVLYERLTKRGDPKIKTFDELVKIDRMYDTIMDTWFCFNGVFNSVENDRDALMEEIMRWYRHQPHLIPSRPTAI